MDFLYAQDVSTFPKPLSELFVLTHILVDDVKTTGSQLRLEPDNGHLRRIFVRLVMTAIEGVVASMKAAILQEHPEQLSIGEEFILSERNYDLKDNGELKIRDNNYSRLPANLRFTFRVFARVFGGGFEINVNGQGSKWTSFLSCIEIRNRLTHPKHFTDLAVSDDETSTADDTLFWFVLQFSGLLIDIQTTDEIKRGLTNESYEDRSKFHYDNISKALFAEDNSVKPV